MRLSIVSTATSVLRDPITRLNARPPSADLAVRVVPMTARLAYIWHHSVQPEVNKLYKHAAPGVANQFVRADVGWDWVHCST